MGSNSKRMQRKHPSSPWKQPLVLSYGCMLAQKASIKVFKDILHSEPSATSSVTDGLSQMLFLGQLPAGLNAPASAWLLQTSQRRQLAKKLDAVFCSLHFLKWVIWELPRAEGPQFPTCTGATPQHLSNCLLGNCKLCFGRLPVLVRDAKSNLSCSLLITAVKTSRTKHYQRIFTPSV